MGSGKSATATVTNTHNVFRTKILSYRFVTENGITIDHKLTGNLGSKEDKIENLAGYRVWNVASKHSMTLNIGDSFEVTYLPKKPGINFPTRDLPILAKQYKC